MFISKPIRESRFLAKWLNSSAFVFVLLLSISSFMIYCCMYGFRKPYTVGLYQNVFFLGVSYKVCLVIAQVVGYMISKFYGIKFISELEPQKRASYIIIAVLLAWFSLLLFAIIPAPYNIFCMLLNGLPLGVIFGLVFGFLEGRRTTEILGAFLVSSFIFGSGFAKSVGKWLLLEKNVSDWWMPFIAGSLFILPLLIFVRILSHSYAPDQTDIDQRAIRNPMTIADRKNFFREFKWAIIPVVITYSFFTVVRDFSEDFANELFIELGYQSQVGIFAQISTFISLIILIVLGSFFLIKSNVIAFYTAHSLIIVGVILSILTTLLFNSHYISPIVWIVTATCGLYMAYLPFNCIYFERFISVYKLKGNVAYLMYIADAFGYLGTILVLIIKEFVSFKVKWVSFFSYLYYFEGVLGIILISVTIYFHYKKLNSKTYQYD